MLKVEKSVTYTLTIDEEGMKALTLIMNLIDAGEFDGIPEDETKKGMMDFADEILKLIELI